MRRIGLTTWIVLALCLLVGVVAVAMTAVVIVRLNRQILASAAELRAGLASPSATQVDPARTELAAYAATVATIQAQWASAVSSYGLRYPNEPIYASVATAQALQAINEMRRPAAVAAIHERWAQAWSERDAALALLARPGLSEEDRTRATDLARHADDEIRRAQNELRDILIAAGIGESDVAAGAEPARSTP